MVVASVTTIHILVNYPFLASAWFSDIIPHFKLGAHAQLRAFRLGNANALENSFKIAFEIQCPLIERAGGNSYPVRLVERYYSKVS